MIFTTSAGIHFQSRFFRNQLVSIVRLLVAFPLVLASNPWESLGAENSPPPLATSHLEETNSLGPIHVYLQLQAQLQATQLAIEQNRQEAKEAAAQNAEALAKGLQSIQQAFAAQRAQDLAAMQSSNKLMLIVASTFAGIGFLTLLMMTWFQWRMSKGLTEISAALPMALGIGPDSAAAALTLARQPVLPLFGATEQPGKPMPGLEQIPRPALRRREETNLSIGNPLFHEPGALVRRHRFRTMSVVVIVGLLCAAGLALLLYVVAYRKLGFG
jgi:hypothetical protein